MSQIYFKKEGMVHYMVMPCEYELKEDYQSMLLKYHEIPYFLQYEVREIDGSQSLYYRLKYRTTLKSVLGHLPLTRLRLENMLMSMIRVMEMTEEYLLEQDGIIWRTDQIFIEADTGNLLFCYCPVGEDDKSSIRQLLTEIMQVIEKKDEESVLFLLKFYNLVTEPDCSLERLKDYIGDNGYAERPTAYAGTGSGMEIPGGYAGMGRSTENPWGYAGTGDHAELLSGYAGAGDYAEQLSGYAGAGDYAEQLSGYAGVGGDAELLSGYVGAGDNVEPSGFCVKSENSVRETRKSRKDNASCQEKGNNIWKWRNLKKNHAGVESAQETLVNREENNLFKREKADLEENKKETVVERTVRVLLLGTAGINFALGACLILNILTYDYIRYLLISMGTLIILTILYMSVSKEETADEIMQAYFEENRKTSPKTKSDTMNTGNPVTMERWYQSKPQTKQNNDAWNRVPEPSTYGETSVLIGGNQLDETNKESIYIEDYNMPLYLESIEKGKYEPIHINSQSVVLGVMPDSCNYILKAQGISRMHAKLMEKADGLYLLDLNSTNGTYINGEMIESGRDYKLEEGDMVTFALSEFYVVREKMCG